MSKISLPDFFKFYKGTVEQKEAVVLLESMMPASLLQEDGFWGEKLKDSFLKPFRKLFGLLFMNSIPK